MQNVSANNLGNKKDTNIYKRVSKYLRDHLISLQEKEWEKKTKEELQKFVILNRV